MSPCSIDKPSDWMLAFRNVMFDLQLPHCIISKFLSL